MSDFGRRGRLRGYTMFCDRRCGPSLFPPVVDSQNVIFAFLTVRFLLSLALANIHSVSDLGAIFLPKR